jgi:hypothetical protein
VEARVEARVTERRTLSLCEVVMKKIHVGQNFIKRILLALAYRDLVEHL